MRLNLVLGHRVERDARLRALRSAAAGVVVVLPVDEEHVVGRRLAVGAELAAFERPDLERRHQAGDCLHEAELASVRARGIVDLVAGDIRPDVAGGRLDDGALRGHCHFFAHTRQVQRQVQRDFLADAQDEALARDRLEALKFG